MSIISSAPDSATLPSATGQHEGMPSKMGPAINLGPYAPKPVRMPHMSPPGDNEGLQSPSGQYEHQGMGGGYPSVESHPAPPQKGVSDDNATLPSPGGQREGV